MNEVEVRNIGTPFYVFDIDVLKKRINYLKSMMPSNVELCYAMKANPFVVKEIDEIIEKYENIELAKSIINLSKKQSLFPQHFVHIKDNL